MSYNTLVPHVYFLVVFTSLVLSSLVYMATGSIYWATLAVFLGVWGCIIWFHVECTRINVGLITDMINDMRKEGGR